MIRIFLRARGARWRDARWRDARARTYALERCAYGCVCTRGAAAALSAASLASAAFADGGIVAASATAGAEAVVAVCDGARGSARCACMRCVHVCARYNTVS